MGAKAHDPSVLQAEDPIRAHHRGNPLADEQDRHTRAPVSYTHLDVYKRQIPFYQ